MKSKEKSEFIKQFTSLCYRHDIWNVWLDFIAMFACALSNTVPNAPQFQDREERYLKTIEKYSLDERLVFPQLAANVAAAFEKNPEQDFLGDLFMDLGLGNKHNGQFFTPYQICQLMAQVTIANQEKHHSVLQSIQEKGVFTLHDPACGAGATLIAGIHAASKTLKSTKLDWRNHIFVSAQDIDETAALMCYIQLSLLNVAAVVKVGNSLTAPMQPNDTPLDYWYTPAIFTPVWQAKTAY